MDQLNAMIEQVAADRDLAAKLTSAASVDERREALHDAGIEITDEIRQQATALSRRLNIDVDDPESWSAVELSDDELEKLGGGAMNWSAIATIGGGSATSAGLTVLVSMSVMG